MQRGMQYLLQRLSRYPARPGRIVIGAGIMLLMVGTSLLMRRRKAKPFRGDPYGDGDLPLGI